MATADIGQQEDVKSGFNTTLVVLAAIAVVAFVCAFALFMQGGFLKVQEIEKAHKIAEAPTDVSVITARAQQQDKLDAGYRWVDKDMGVAGMSIENAKTQLVKKLAAENVSEETAEAQTTDSQ